MSKAAILLIEDNEKILATNAKALSMQGYEIITAVTLQETRKILAEQIPDLIILDIMLPDGSGLDFCQELQRTYSLPILFLTALGKTKDILRGYNSGGVDYITKPYSMDILLAKVNVLLRLTQTPGQANGHTLGELRIDTAARRAYLSGEDMLLKPKEFAVLELLVKSKDCYLTPEQIYERLWALPTADDVRTVHNHIYALRKRMEGSSITIENRRAKGYRLVER